MENTKIGNKEAIALLITIAFNQIIIFGVKSIVNNTSSASLLNLMYLSVIVLVFTCLICYLLNKFPSFDLIDISDYLGGNVLKWIVGILFFAYFIVFAGNSLHLFSSCLEIIYFPLTLLSFIRLFLVIGATITCLFKNNAIYRSNFVVFPLIIISTIFMFFSDMKYFDIENVYPMFGDGFFYTFVSGLNNLIIFQSLAYIFFLPPLLKNSQNVKKIAVTSIIISCILNLLCVATVLFTFDGFTEIDELMPLYSAVKHIEYGEFFRKMDSIFFLIWIICFVSYLSLSLKFSANILKKLTYAKSDFIFIFICAILLFVSSGWQKNYSTSLIFAENFFRYFFFVLVFGISLVVLISACIKKKRLDKKN